MFRHWSGHNAWPLCVAYLFALFSNVSDLIFLCIIFNGFLSYSIFHEERDRRPSTNFNIYNAKCIASIMLTQPLKYVQKKEKRLFLCTYLVLGVYLRTVSRTGDAAMLQHYCMSYKFRRILPFCCWCCVRWWYTSCTRVTVQYGHCERWVFRWGSQYI